MNDRMEHQSLALVYRSNGLNRSIRIVNRNCFMVLSQSVEGKWYTVNKMVNSDVWACTCPHFRYKISKGSDENKCKHIMSAQIYRRTIETEIDIDNGIEYAEKLKICRMCYSTKTKKCGKRKLKNGTKRQRYMCRQCKYRFVMGEHGFRKVKTDPDIIAESINLVMSGLSYRSVARHLKQTRKLRISHTTVYGWNRKYMSLIKKYVDRIVPPYLSGVWSVDEMVINVKGTKKTKWGFYDWLWTTVDPKTRFIIASEVSKRHGLNDARRILWSSKQKIGRADPEFIITDSLSAYDKAILQEIGISKAFHLKTKSLSEGFENRPIERIHNEIRSVIKTKRGLGNDNSAQKFADSYRIYHNYVRPHSGLPNNITPAEASGVNLNLGENKIKSLIVKSTEYEYDYEKQLGRRIDLVEILEDEYCIRVVPKGFIKKQKWREINDILWLNGFSWVQNGQRGSWIRE